MGDLEVDSGDMDTSRRIGALASEPERGRRQLWTAFLIFRWGSIAWMIVLAASARPPLHRSAIAWIAIASAVAWNAWLTLKGARQSGGALWGDLAVTAGLVLLSGVVIAPGQIGIEGPAFTTFYKWSTPMAWGAARGIGPGVLAGVTLSAAYVLSRPINGLPLGDMSPGQLQNIATTVVIFLAIGAAVGAVSRMQERASRQLRAVMEEALRERERAGRLQEREELGREIHDSVLQVLALVHKRGRELARRVPIPPSEILELADMAGAQENSLRSLILRQPDLEPGEHASLRTALESLARTVPSPPVLVSTVGPVWMPSPVLDEVLAAVRQAVDNVAQHAAATRVSVFAEEHNGHALVTVRDDGCGFIYDETVLERGGKFGILRSIKGRIEDLEGTVRVETAPGRGTEIELSVPVVRR
jgi:signal transduction histidine kinase